MSHESDKQPQMAESGDCAAALPLQMDGMAFSLAPGDSEELRRRIAEHNGYVDLPDYPDELHPLKFDPDKAEALAGRLHELCASGALDLAGRFLNLHDPGFFLSLALPVSPADLAAAEVAEVTLKKRIAKLRLSVPADIAAAERSAARAQTLVVGYDDQVSDLEAQAVPEDKAARKAHLDRLSNLRYSRLMAAIAWELNADLLVERAPSDARRRNHEAARKAISDYNMPPLGRMPA